MLFRGVFFACKLASFGSTVTEVRIPFTASHTELVISTFHPLFPASSCVYKRRDVPTG